MRGTPNRARRASLDRSLPHPDLPGSLGLQGGPVLLQPWLGEGGLLFSKFPPVALESPLNLGGSEPQRGHSLLGTSGWGPTAGWGGHQGGSVLTACPASSASGRLRLVVLPEDRLQMKWRESEGSSLGYLVQVKPRAGRGPRLASVQTDGEHIQHGGRSAGSPGLCPTSSLSPH